jgi:hypothetical protein
MEAIRGEMERRRLKAIIALILGEINTTYRNDERQEE